MIDRERTFFTIMLALLIYPGDNLGGASQPEFTKPLANLTVALGRDAIFTCHVEHLGGYKVGWVKVDTKAIQAIHDRVITHNRRVSVSHGDRTTWNLRIKGVQKEDEGLYMCQINTDPMKSQTGMLTIEVPPDFIPEQTSGDMVIPEGQPAHLRCRATGIPAPRVSWRREDQKEIIIRDPNYDKSSSPIEKFKVQKVSEWIGQDLNLTKIKRDEMGVYNCIASNGVPPSISKRISVEVYFPPEIQVPNQLVGAPLGTDVVLECIVQAFPQSINFWRNNNDTIIISSGRHEVQVVTKAPMKSHGATHPNFKLKMLLIIHNFTKQDVGKYKCAAKNSNGENEGSIRLYDISSVVEQKPAGESAYNIHQSPDYGPDNSGYDSTDEDGTMDVERTDTGRGYGALDNTVLGHANGGSGGFNNGQATGSGSGSGNSGQVSGKTRGKRPANHQHSLGSSHGPNLLLMVIVLVVMMPVIRIWRR